MRKRNEFVYLAVNDLTDLIKVIVDLGCEKYTMIMGYLVGIIREITYAYLGRYLHKMHNYAKPTLLFPGSYWLGQLPRRVLIFMRWQPYQPPLRAVSGTLPVDFAIFTAGR